VSAPAVIFYFFGDHIRTCPEKKFPKIQQRCDDPKLPDAIILYARLCEPLGPSFTRSPARRSLPSNRWQVSWKPPCSTMLGRVIFPLSLAPCPTRTESESNRDDQDSILVAECCLLAVSAHTLPNYGVFLYLFGYRVIQSSASGATSVRPDISHLTMNLSLKWAFPASSTSADGPVCPI
jgi:hypothetical protein